MQDQTTTIAAYFIKGWLGLVVQVMVLDSGYIQSLVHMEIYNRFHSDFRSGIRLVKGHGNLADGSKITFAEVPGVNFVKCCFCLHSSVLTAFIIYPIILINLFSNR